MSLVHSSTGSSRSEPLSQLQPKLAALAGEARSIDMRRYETTAFEASHRDLVTHTLRLAGDARALVAKALEACTPVASEPGDDLLFDGPLVPFERALDAAVVRQLQTISGVEDIVFLVQLELRQRIERLERLAQSTSVASVLCETDGALRRIVKGLGAIDLAVSRAEGTPALLDFAPQLHESLQVRGAYAKLRARLLEAGERHVELYPRMRAVGTCLAILVGWSAYPALRVRDRLQLRELQQRILLWLLPENRADELAGQRLWEDVVSFVAMLWQVNRRQELVEHDTEVVRRALAELEAEHALSPETLGALGSLEGLDEELDRAVLAGAPREAGDWHTLLLGIGARLGLGQGGRR